MNGFDGGKKQSWINAQFCCTYVHKSVDCGTHNSRVSLLWLVHFFVVRVCYTGGLVGISGAPTLMYKFNKVGANFAFFSWEIELKATRTIWWIFHSFAYGKEAHETFQYRVREKPLKDLKQGAYETYFQYNFKVFEVTSFCPVGGRGGEWRICWAWDPCPKRGF